MLKTNHPTRPLATAVRLWLLCIMGGLLTTVSFAVEEESKQPGSATAPIFRLPVPAAKWTDYQGREWSSSEFSGKKGIVYAFLGTECPLAKIYTTKLVEMEKEFRDRGVAFVAVDSNVQDSLTAMAAHARAFKIDFPFVKDPDQSWADALGVTRTPEVCVVDAAGVLVYRGRIDDQYGIGFVREEPTVNDLYDAIESVLSGTPVKEPVTKAPGCLIGRRRGVSSADAAEDAPTYAEHVSHILQKRCVSCHRSDEIGPMNFTRYDDVVAWSDMILEVIQQGRMPPWHASPDHGEFSNDSRLTQEEIDTLHAWVQQGTLRGDPALEPAPLPQIEGWQIPREPDMVFAMADKPFQVPARGDVKYQYFAVDPKNETDLWVQGMEIVPGNRAVVHHILVFVRDKANRRIGGLGAERGFLTGYVPGTRVVLMPEGMAKRIPANHELLFQVHYTPIGTEQEDLSKVAFWLTEPEKVQYEVQTTSSLQPRLNIPPNDGNHKVTSLPPEHLAESRLLAMTPHMHLRGKSFRYTAIYPDRTREILLDVPNYDFNWQTEYRLAGEKRLPEGTRIYCEASFDNSSKNLNNPAPDQWVRWGDQTYEEMMIGYFHIAVPIDPATGIGKSGVLHRSIAEMKPIEIFDYLDLDGDGKLIREDVPHQLHDVFKRLDRNGDDVLERSEVPGAAS